MTALTLDTRLPRVIASGIAIALALSGAAGTPAAAQVPPLVFDMLQNLASVQRVHEHLALGDYDGVRQDARDLAERARGLAGADLAAFKLDPAHDAQFDAFLSAQAEAARAIDEAAAARDAGGVLLGVDSMYRNACLACHATFRDSAGLLRPATLFMTTFQAHQREIHRGASTRDFALVARQAREIESLTRVLGWDQVIEATFALAKPEERTEFRGYLNRMGLAANRIEQAATEEDVSKLLGAWRDLWEEGCVACHQRFRPGAPRVER